MSKHIYKNATAHLPEHCRPTAEILTQFGGKWAIAVIGQLNAGPRRFSELADAISGISERMLTLTLRTLERDGLIERHVTPSVPPRVDYELSARGRSLQEPLIALHIWATEHMADIEESRREFDASDR
ncbi:hypothetical protein JP75_23645 [Devosia riboflavina]|uniref:HTH hxlR-type domain-containing protein n=1 Tax=Devosia riboflavina TaxID=46914 RepID=A0A087LWJ2_9HYPH|nr:helix-turn-helix domain-containing protein [Devosia riboflavina]KFL28995.1 hypothetical protein JP75_23645 [Devosia riboflavina]